MFFVLMMVATASQAEPSFDCTKASSTVEGAICDDAKIAALDVRLAERFKSAMATAAALDAGAGEAQADLRGTQRGWIKGRDDCWKSDDLRQCVEASYLHREVELVAYWMLEEPTATAFWACEGGPEVVTIFFATALPGARLEIGDSVRTVHLVPAASGSRYSGDFGEEIWTKGDEARYRAPDPDGTEYTCKLRAQD
jgi:uncharacterized protein YecT (DUF1311 family)